MGNKRSRLFRSLIISTALATCGMHLQAQAQMGQGLIADEATVFEEQSGENGGGYTTVCVGNLSSLNSTRHAYIRYTLPDIPAGATVTRVRLNITQIRVRFQGVGAPKTATLEVRRVSGEWTEGTGTGANGGPCGGGANVNGIDWANAPASSGVASATKDLPTTSNFNVAFDTDVGSIDDGLIDDVQTWVDNGANNFGWRLSIEEETDNARNMDAGSLTIDWTLPEPEIDVQGNNTSITDGDSTPSLADHTDFGSTDVSAGSVMRIFTIRNTGPGTLNLSGTPRVAVSGAHAADFSVTTQPAASVTSGSNTNFQVTFNPSASGMRTASLSIPNNDANENPYNFSIRGTGTATFTVGGNLAGLAPGNSVVLQNNATNNLTLNADGPFTFSTPLLDGSAYSVTVLTQPTTPNQTCSVGNGSGNLSGANVTNVIVTCVTNTYSVGGNVSGLSGSGLVLQNNGGDNVPISGNGPFTFATPLADGSNYSVTVFSQPTGPSQICSVTNGSGTLAGENVSNVSVTCVANTFTIGGNVSGLAGSGLVLRNNGGNNLSINNNGPFSFSTPLTNGSPYSVTVFSQPTNPAQVCSVSNGSGTVNNANVTNVAVTCVTTTFTIGGSVSGLLGTGLVLRNNGGNNLSITNNGPFVFSNPLPDSSNYSVTVFSQPGNPVQTCSVANGSGTLSGNNVTNVAVNCNTPPATAADSYTVDEDVTLNADDSDGSGNGDPNDDGVLANDSDADGDALSVLNPGQFTAGGLGGTITMSANGTFSYTPPTDQFGVATFSFNVGDGVHSIPSSLSIEVLSVNDPPSFLASGDVNFPQGGRGATQISAWATAIDAGAPNESGQTLNFDTQVISDPAGVLNSASVDTDGDLQLDLSSEGGTATLEVTLMDNGGGDDQSAPIQFDVNVTRAADLVTSIDNAFSLLPAGNTVVYRVTVDNLGPADVVGATVLANIPTELANATWTCSATGLGTCSANGVGDLAEVVDLPVGARVTFEISVDVPLAAPEVPVSFTATTQMPGDTVELTSANNSDTDTDTIGVFGDSFE